ncbi:hypothetical protein QFC22_005095 [Naganishia vaughanmartiniae]|uniref:Uncharacterized protein n=1 Tax=Naganishia vaughanmartiniae TaxID=1424756 RepID=A0ACC2WZL4_9TREE|nr:hypothetical protein QFC22_005095 [Naganishia vaughanmartiniae]
MSRISQPELKKYMDRRVYVHIQANRAMSGVLRGYDMFLNLVLEQSFEELGAGERKPCGTSYNSSPMTDADASPLLSPSALPDSRALQIIRGNSVSSLELVDSQKVYQERPAGGAPRM